MPKTSTQRIFLDTIENSLLYCGNDVSSLWKHGLYSTLAAGKCGRIPGHYKANDIIKRAVSLADRLSSKIGTFRLMQRWIKNILMKVSKQENPSMRFYLVTTYIYPTFSGQGYSCVQNIFFKKFSKKKFLKKKIFYFFYIFRNVISNQKKVEKIFFWKNSK